MKRNSPHEEVTVFQCCCESPDHVFSVRESPGEEGWEPELRLTLHLATHQRPWKRLWLAIRYVLGLEPGPYYHFVDVLLDDSDAWELALKLTEYRRKSLNWRADNPKEQQR